MLILIITIIVVNLSTRNIVKTDVWYSGDQAPDNQARQITQGVMIHVSQEHQMLQPLGHLWHILQYQLDIILGHRVRR